MMSDGVFNPATGRTTHLTANGRLLESKPMYFSAAEWALLYQLSRDSGVSLGKCISDMAKAERKRRIDRMHRSLERLDPLH